MYIFETFPLTPAQRLYVSSFLDNKYDAGVIWSTTSTELPDVVVVTMTFGKIAKRKYPLARVLTVGYTKVEEVPE